jgi:hypothetical protein
MPIGPVNCHDSPAGERLYDHGTRADADVLAL